MKASPHEERAKLMPAISTNGDGHRSSARVLVVDDYEPFRKFVCSMLGRNAAFQLVGQASDGPEAVHKAAKLQPDLIVLDIGLPTLSGLVTARRIKQISPKSKILFLSQDSSAAVVQEALGIGAHGYIVKEEAGEELLAALDAFLLGKEFMNRSSAGFGAATAV
jgi:DNA-binding NarL/FixJ family response regulator